MPVYNPYNRKAMFRALSKLRSKVATQNALREEYITEPTTK